MSAEPFDIVIEISMGNNAGMGRVIVDKDFKDSIIISKSGANLVLVFRLLSISVQLLCHGRQLSDLYHGEIKSDAKIRHQIV